MNPKADRYGAVAIVLHWTIAAAMVFQLVLGLRADDLKTPGGFALIQLHKSVGISILVLSLARLGWRLANPPPPFSPGMSAWERGLAKAAHWLFYGLLIALPLTGWIMVSTSRIAIPTLLFHTIPWPHVPVLATLAAPAKAAWNGAAHEAHSILAWTAWALIALHVAGALKHQLFAADEPVLARMAPGAKAGRRLEPRLAVVLIGAGLAAFAAANLHPALPKSAPPPVAVAVEPEPEVTAATPAPVVAPDPAKPVEPSVWKVAKGSTLSFFTAWSDTAIEGRFDRWTADILFAPEALARSHVKVDVDLASAATGDAQRDEALPSPDWLDAAGHASARFEAHRFEQTGPGRFVAHGVLTLRGVSKPVALAFRLKIDGDRARMTGVTTLDRTAFGVGQGEWQATDQIPRDVKVRVSLTATRA